MEVVMRSFLLFVALVSLPATAQVDPIAVHRHCLQLADYALTARALTAAKLDRRTADEILEAMYAFRDASSIANASRIRAAARRLSESRAARPFAYAIGNGCLASGGNIDVFLGTEG